MGTKKIMLSGFVAQNLGDDLFFKIITDRYKDIQFYMIPEVKDANRQFEKLDDFLGNYHNNRIQVE